MNIIDISFDSVCYITIQLNWLAILVLCVAVIGINYLKKKSYYRLKKILYLRPRDNARDWKQ